jgi:hypothetical protein
MRKASNATTPSAAPIASVRILDPRRGAMLGGALAAAPAAATATGTGAATGADGVTTGALKTS